MALNYLALGRRIQRLRNQHGISQLKFSELIDKSPAFVSQMERGKKGPSLETLVLIAETLNVGIDTLLPEFRDSSALEKESEVCDVFSDCTEYERFILTNSLQSLKRFLRDGEHLKSGS